MEFNYIIKLTNKFKVLLIYNNFRIDRNNIRELNYNVKKY